jgi:hypothetical protein
MAMDNVYDEDVAETGSRTLQSYMGLSIKRTETNSIQLRLRSTQTRLGVLLVGS